MNVTEAWSNHKVKLCHEAEIHCRRVWNIFYMIFVRVFCWWTSFCIRCCCLNTWNEVTRPCAPPRFEVCWTRWWLHFQENVTGAQSNHTSKCVMNFAICRWVQYIFHVISFVAKIMKTPENIMALHLFHVLASVIVGVRENPHVPRRVRPCSTRK